MIEPNENNINERIIQIIKKFELSNKKFASKIGVTDTTVKNYMIGKNKPGFDPLVNIITVFNISPEWLLFGTGTMERTVYLIPDVEPNLVNDDKAHYKPEPNILSKSDIQEMITETIIKLKKEGRL